MAYGQICTVNSEPIHLRQFDHYLPVTLKVGERQIANIPCKVYLPDEPSGSLELHLFLTDAQANIGFPWKFSLHGSLTRDGKPVLSISANTVYVNEGWKKSHALNLEELRVVAEPADLDVVHHFAGSRRKRGPYYGCFWITPNAFLTPDTYSISKSDGSTKVKTVRPVSFNLQSGHLEFAKRVRRRSSQESGGGQRTIQDLVSEFSLATSAEKTERVSRERLNDLDDFLLIASFASRQLCVCVGWMVADGRTVMQHYRRDRSARSVRKSAQHDEGLIDIADFEEFTQTAYDRFVSMEPAQRDAIRQAMQRITSSSDEPSIEYSYISLYSALETIVLEFRKVEKLEYTLPNNEWKRFQVALKDVISAYPTLKDDDNLQRLIYEKLPELRRIGFGTAFDLFRNSPRHPVQIDDLWPINGSRSLSALRNQLVHGEIFGDDRTMAIWAARSHLLWTVERMILAGFGWPQERSHVTPNYLQHHTAYNKVTHYQSLIWPTHATSE